MTLQRFKDLTGQLFGHLTVLGPTSDRQSDGCMIWLCHCFCGKELKASTNRLARKDRSVKSCGCVRRGKTNPLYSGCGDLTGAKFAHIQGSARRRKIVFSISIQEAWNLLVSQNELCALTGRRIKLVPEYKARSGDPSTASLDRIDSSKGYILGNVQWVHKIVNQMKWALSSDEFLEWCDAVVEFKRKS